jgi:hypothetical protein
LRQFARWGVQGAQIAPPAGTADTSTAWLAPTATRAAQLQLILAVPGVPDLTEHARAWPHVFAFARERRSPAPTPRPQTARGRFRAGSLVSRPSATSAPTA